jgi:predicted DNA-binding antitoxin AbrB/MazE fold protein
MKTIRATFSNGIIKPLEKLEYPEGKELTITIREETEIVSKEKYVQILQETAGSWEDIDADKFLEDIYKSRSINTRAIAKL